MRGVHLPDEGMEAARVEAEVLVRPIDHPIRLIFGINDQRIRFVVLRPVLDLIDHIPRLRVFFPKQVLMDEVEVPSILLVRPSIFVPFIVGLGMGSAKKSGRALSEQGAKKAASESVERLAKTYGTEVLPVVEDSGLELLEAIPRYGDEVVKIAAKASPQARRAFAMNVPDLLPLARRVGVESLELEAKAPGLSSRVFQVFGDDAGKGIAKSVPREDVPRLLKYGELADSPKTRQMLLGAYEKEGRSLFERVPPKIVLASGLSAAMLLGTYEVTAPDRALAKSIEDNPGMAQAILSQKVAWSALLTILVVGILLWRFGLMPWQRKVIRATSGKRFRSA